MTNKFEQFTIYRLCFNELQPIDPHTHNFCDQTDWVEWKQMLAEKCLMLKWIIELKITVTEEQNQNILYMKLKEKSQKYIHILN